MACCARACVVASSWKQAANICESKELSCGGKGPPSLPGPADVTGGGGGNCSVCDCDARLCRIGSSHNDPRCSDCPVPSDRVLFPRAQREQAEPDLASPLELRYCYVARIGPSGPLLWVYCLLAPFPTTRSHTHMHTASPQAYSCRREGPLADAHICRS